MTEYTELKRTAEAANAVTGDASVDITISSEHGPNQPEIDAVTAFVGGATPAAVLALIAENERLNAENKQLIALECHGGTAEAAINLLAERDQLKAENEALRDHLRLRVSAMPRDRLRETFNAAYYGPRELGSDGDQCRAGVLAVIDAVMGKGEQS